MSLVPFMRKDARKVWLISLTTSALVCLIALGVMAENGWLPRTDPVSGKKTGWFGRELSTNNATSTWNPLAAPPTSPTPQLSKEYIYAGSRLLAVEDANANPIPPADLAVWRPSDGNWYVLGGAGSAQTQYSWGDSTDIPAPGDFDGDGKTDFSVFRPGIGRWYWIASSTGASYWYSWGQSGDIPAPADFDGDGKTDITIYRPSNNTWYFVYSSSWQSGWLQSGFSGSKPAPADYDGDGIADIAEWAYATTGSYFYIKRSSDNQVQYVQLGSASTDTPVSADYDGDGKADPSVLAGNVWTIRYSSTNTTGTVTWQNSGDIPVQNDYDGDGKVDIAIWRASNGNWYIRQSGSSNSLRQVSWGMSGDIPVPAYYRR